MATRDVVTYIKKQKLSKNIKLCNLFQMFYINFMVIVLILASNSVNALIATEKYTPQGTNPKLYNSQTDKIIQLDQKTFDDTIFQNKKNFSFIVEFYADWCGHCRAFALHYREFANSVSNWKPIVYVAAINCADSFNINVCRGNDIVNFPTIKYFPVNATNYTDAIEVAFSSSVSDLRLQLSTKLINEYQIGNYSGWPNLNPLIVNEQTQFDDLWKGNFSADHLLIIFESLYDTSIGIQTIFDLWAYRSYLNIRRAAYDSPLVKQLKIKEFPYIVLFKSNFNNIILRQKYNQSSSQNVISLVLPNENTSLTTLMPTNTVAMPQSLNCETNPEKCKMLYYVSEVDMLKAIHMALYNEVIKNDNIKDRHFTNLYNFVKLLSEDFPISSSLNQQNSNKNNTTLSNSTKTLTRQERGKYLEQTQLNETLSEPIILKRSQRAREVFKMLKENLEYKIKRGITNISGLDWDNEFQNAERLQGYPFPITEQWDHCRGSLPEFRGYTCGLWTTFHALTVHSYLKSLNNSKTNGLVLLEAIQGWVDSFFGCIKCREHFMDMTTKTFKMKRVKQPKDAIFYLWSLHNKVNRRLSHKPTEDKLFPKYQFPPKFLCKKCSKINLFSRNKIKQFLVDYYTNIKS